MADNTLRERVQFAKGKTPIVAKYIDEHHKLFSEIAGRGFDMLPGYAYSAENGIEFLAKNQLSELNYKILAETIEHELKQTGIDYGIAYKNALMAWELEKQALMNAWEAELASIKQGMASDEETLNLLAIEVSKRAIDLLNAKTAIEISMEADRKTIVELDATVSPYEVQLANAKLATAQKKLELLPIINEIIAKEYVLLVAEQSKGAYYTQYMAAEHTLMIKKQTLTPYINILASLSEQYALLITSTQIPAETALVNEKVKQAGFAVQANTSRISEITTNIANENKKIALLGLKRALEVKHFDKEQKLITGETGRDNAFNTLENAYYTTLITNEDAAHTYINTKKSNAHKTETKMRVDSTDTLTTAEKGSQDDKAQDEIRKINGEAAANSAVAITASLKHIIG